MRWVIVVAGLLVTTLPATAQDGRAGVLAEYNKKNFEGWDGLAFYCSMRRPEDETNKALCEWAGQRIRLLAKPLNIPVLIASDKFQHTLDKRSSPGLLDVELEIFSTKGSPFALYVAVRVGPYYSGPVETANPKGPETKPRAGTLVMWHRSLISSGIRGPDFDATVRQHLDTMIMEFISDFAEGR